MKTKSQLKSRYFMYEYIFFINFVKLKIIFVKNIDVFTLSTKHISLNTAEGKVRSQLYAVRLFHKRQIALSTRDKSQVGDYPKFTRWMQTRNVSTL